MPVLRLRSQQLLMALFICLGLAVPRAVAAGTDYYRMDDNAIWHFHQAQKWMEVEEYDAAAREFQIAIRLKPSTLMTASLYNDLGWAYLGLRDYPKAIVSFQQATTLNPNFSLYYENLVKAYQKAGALSTAQEQLSDAVAMNPDDGPAWFLLGLIQQASGDGTAGQSSLRRFVQLNPDSELADAARLYLPKPEDSQSDRK